MFETLPPLEVAFHVDELIQRKRVMSHHMRENGLLFNLEQLRQDRRKKKCVGLCG